MAAWKLNDAEWDALDEVRISTNDSDVFRNATVILMTGVGRSKFDIAKDLGCSPATVDNVRKRYRERGLEGLQRRPPPGRTSRHARVSRRLRQAVQTPPQTLGYGFSVWSANRLAKHLEKTTKITLGDDRLRSILAEEGFSFQRPKHTMKGKRNKAASVRASGELKVLKKSLRKNAGEVLIFQDEVEIHRHPALARMWAPVGQQPEVPAPGKNEKKVVYGGVDYKTGKLTYTLADTKCGAAFLVFLVARVTASRLSKPSSPSCATSRAARATTAGWRDKHAGPGRQADANRHKKGNFRPHADLHGHSK